jgi:Fumarylacetoacetase N-terminal
VNKPVVNMVDLTRPCVLPVPEGSHFPVQNLPFGTFRRRSGDAAPRTGVRIGDNVLDMARLADAGCFNSQQVYGACFHQVPRRSTRQELALSIGMAPACGGLRMRIIK